MMTQGLIQHSQPLIAGEKFAVGWLVPMHKHTHDIGVLSGSAFAVKCTFADGVSSTSF